MVALTTLVLTVTTVAVQLAMGHPKEKAGATEVINYEEAPVLETLNDLTAGRGPDACIDAVGMESHIDVRPLQAYDRAKQAVGAESDRPHALREANMACANGGVVSVIGVYGGWWTSSR